MRFWHTASLLGLMQSAALLWVWRCADGVAARLALSSMMAALALGWAVSHLHERMHRSNFLRQVRLTRRAARPLASYQGLVLGLELGSVVRDSGVLAPLDPYTQHDLGLRDDAAEAALHEIEAEMEREMQKIVALRHAADGDEIIRRLHEELRRAREELSRAAVRVREATARREAQTPARGPELYTPRPYPTLTTPTPTRRDGRLRSGARAPILGSGSVNSIRGRRARTRTRGTGARARARARARTSA